MNPFYTLAEAIPDDIRETILTSNIVCKAVPEKGDPHMEILVVVYQNYLNIQGMKVDMSNPCLSCLSKIIELFTAMESALIQLQQEFDLLNNFA